MKIALIIVVAVVMQAAFASTEVEQAKQIRENGHKNPFVFKEGPFKNWKVREGSENNGQCKYIEYVNPMGRVIMFCDLTKGCEKSYGKDPSECYYQGW